MNLQFRSIAAIILAGLWINASEFFRNEILLKSYWANHYQSLELTFPSEPLNGIVWVIWGFLFATAIHVVSRRFGLVQTALVCWLMGFVLMWIVLWNLSVLPGGILVFAVPLSFLEALVGSYICRKISPPV